MLRLPEPSDTCAGCATPPRPSSSNPASEPRPGGLPATPAAGSRSGCPNASFRFRNAVLGVCGIVFQRAYRPGDNPLKTCGISRQSGFERDTYPSPTNPRSTHKVNLDTVSAKQVGFDPLQLLVPSHPSPKTVNVPTRTKEAMSRHWRALDLPLSRFKPQGILGSRQSSHLLQILTIRSSWARASSFPSSVSKAVWARLRTSPQSLLAVNATHLERGHPALQEEGKTLGAEAEVGLVWRDEDDSAVLTSLRHAFTQPRSSFTYRYPALLRRSFAPWNKSPPR